jgi:hypothetical protein
MNRIVLPFLFCISTAHAQSTVSPAASFAYSANGGWIDLRPSDADGVRLTEMYLSGKAYAANFGWIDLGDGTPSNGHSYSNASSTDYGVNLAANGALTGSAYSANIGWIAFEQNQGKPKLNLLTGQITGYAYAANAGWIALDTTTSDLATLFLARPDTDGDGITDAWEHMHFANLTTASAISDADGDGTTDLQEYEAGTDPQDLNSVFRIVSHSFGTGGTLASITFTSSPGRLYRLEHDADLQGSWTDSSLGIFQPDAGSLTNKEIPVSGGTIRFIRAVSIKPLPP